MRRAVLNVRDDRPAWAPPASLPDRLRAVLGDGWELVDVETPVSGRGDGSGISTEALDAIRGAEVHFGFGLPRELLLAGLEPPSRLRWIHTGAAGVRAMLHPELANSNIVLTNSAGIHAEPIAESVIGMMLYFARGFDHAVSGQQHATWRADLFEQQNNGVRELDGAALGIIGYGGIGRAIARRAHALGMVVTALKRERAAPDGISTIVTGHGALHDIVAHSDFIAVSVPSTNETRGMLSADVLARMRNNAALINVARGDVLDESALTDMLQAGRLRGAALDVFVQEPLPPDSRLWRMPNVLITPHVSAASPRFWEREADLMLDNTRRYLDGDALRNVVDVSAGY